MSDGKPLHYRRFDEPAPVDASGRVSLRSLFFNSKTWARASNPLKHWFIVSSMIRLDSAGMVEYTSYAEGEAERDLKAMLILLHASKVFEIPGEVTQLLLKTKNIVRPTRLPFPVMFIDASLTLPNIWHRLPSGEMGRSPTTYYGFLLCESGEYRTRFGTASVPRIGDSENPNIYAYAVFEDQEGGVGHVKLSLYKEYEDIGNIKKDDLAKWRQERQRLREFFMNILDFLHDPDVVLIDVQRAYDPKSRKAERHGHGVLKLPGKVVQVRGRLRQYLNQVRTGQHFTYSHRFWVRGHWRHLRSKWFRNKRGLRLWIVPFVKGQGMLIEKRYQLKEPVPAHAEVEA